MVRMRGSGAHGCASVVMGGVIREFVMKSRKGECGVWVEKQNVAFPGLGVNHDAGVCFFQVKVPTSSMVALSPRWRGHLPGRVGRTYQCRY